MKEGKETSHCDIGLKPVKVKERQKRDWLRGPAEYSTDQPKKKNVVS